MMKTVWVGVLLACLVGCETGPRQVLPYVQAGETGTDLYLYDVAGGLSTRLLQTPNVDESDPAVDYPGQRVAYITRQGTGEEAAYALRIHDLKAGQARVLFESVDPLASPVWSNKGKKLAYIVEREGRLQVEVHDFKKGETKTIGFGSSPSWRVDDGAIFYSSRDRADAESGDLVVHDLKTGINQSLKLRGNSFANLAKGASVVYTTLPYSRRNEAVWIMDANGRQKRLTSPGKAYRDTDPVHINGSKFVAFTRTDVETGQSSIYVVERYAQDPVETLLFEVNNNVSTK